VVRSDVQVVEEIHDRRSFERFIGEGVRTYHLDDTTLAKFRNRIWMLVCGLACNLKRAVTLAATWQGEVRLES